MIRTKKNVLGNRKLHIYDTRSIRASTSSSAYKEFSLKSNWIISVMVMSFKLLRSYIRRFYILSARRYKLWSLSSFFNGWNETVLLLSVWPMDGLSFWYVLSVSQSWFIGAERAKREHFAHFCKIIAISTIFLLVYTWSIQRGMSRREVIQFCIINRCHWKRSLNNTKWEKVGKLHFRTWFRSWSRKFKLISWARI